jgi:hypothetical protein
MEEWLHMWDLTVIVLLIWRALIALEEAHAILAK